ncbi:MAG: hypothetical protein EHM41_00850 [Chloroflexi bacterium]|nr:MAG: hypothetical protein EHM41_00850 [Chloroflexota bacterium]
MKERKEEDGVVSISEGVISATDGENIAAIDPGVKRSWMSIFKKAGIDMLQKLYGRSYETGHAHQDICKQVDRMLSKLKMWGVTTVLVETTPAFPGCCARVSTENTAVERSIRCLLYRSGMTVIPISSTKIKRALKLCNRDYAKNKRAAIQFARDHCVVDVESDHDADCFCLAWWYCCRFSAATDSKTVGGFGNRCRSSR